MGSRPRPDVWALGLIAFAMLTGRSYWRAAASADAEGSELVHEVRIGPSGPPASDRAAELGAGNLLPSSFDAWFALLRGARPRLALPRCPHGRAWPSRPS